MAQLPTDSESAPPQAALGDVPPGADDPTWAWHQVQPVAPVLPRHDRSRRRIPVVLGAGGLILVLALVGGVGLNLLSSPLTASVAGAGSSASPAAPAGPQGFGQQICQDFLASLATRLGVSVAALETALGGAAGDTIDQLVQQGRLTADQATKLKDALSANASRPCTASGRMGLGAGALRGGWLTPFARGFGHRGAGPTIDVNAIFDAAVSVLKTDRKTLQHEIAALGKGQDLRTIAAKHGVSYATFTAAIHAAVRAQLDTAVTKGTLTAAQETTLLARVDDALDAGRLGGFGYPGGRMGGWGGVKLLKPSPSPTSPGA